MFGTPGLETVNSQVYRLFNNICTFIIARVRKNCYSARIMNCLNNLGHFGEFRLYKNAFFSACGEKFLIKVAEKLGCDAALNESSHYMNRINVS